jgi:FlaA1/EpsC-like NDP-sugar epimerase
MINVIDTLKFWHKNLLAMMHDATMSCLCFYISLALRFETIDLNALPQLKNFYTYLLIICISQFTMFKFSGLYRGIWRYSSSHDLIRLIKGVTFATLFSFICLFLFFRLEGIPRSTIIMDWSLLILTLGGGRLAYRLLRDKRNNSTAAKINGIKTMIVGAGPAGEQILRDIKRHPELGISIIGFIEDDPYAQGKLLHGVPVMGGTDNIEKYLHSRQVKQLLITLPSTDGLKINTIVESCRNINIKIKILPDITDVLKGNISINQLRDLELEDLIGRKQIHLDQASIMKMLEGKKVLVTGAGGSIGSELVNQILKYNPAKIVLVDISEYNLFMLQKDLEQRFPLFDSALYIIMDVRDLDALDNLFKVHTPEVILHTAAYKHVPLMEENPEQALKTNIQGTDNVAKCAAKYQVEKFVLVSTDKAVNPTNVMGATKRAAELICQIHQLCAPQTVFTTVRFGNVVGSSGSVIPLFQKQIKSGGPITITHPKIERFFMSIPEASQLILQASLMGKGGEIFVLDMGKPIKIVTIAKKLIALSNMKEGTDIEIKFVGLRPGEKLYEEVLFDDEKSLPTNHHMLRISQACSPEDHQYKELIKLANSKGLSLKEIKENLKEIIDEYDPEQMQNKKFEDLDSKDNILLN